jgi:hypothetical protein
VVELCDRDMHQALKRCESSRCGMYPPVGVRRTFGTDKAKSFEGIAYYDRGARLIAGLMVRVGNNCDASKRCV